MATVEEKRQHELHTVHLMLEIYCHGKHHTKKGLCSDCEDLWQYVQKRVAHCPHMATKTFCSTCPTHCYAPKRQEEIATSCATAARVCSGTHCAWLCIISIFKLKQPLRNNARACYIYYVIKHFGGVPHRQRSWPSSSQNGRLYALHRTLPNS